MNFITVNIIDFQKAIDSNKETKVTMKNGEIITLKLLRYTNKYESVVASIDGKLKIIKMKDVKKIVGGLHNEN